MKWAKKQTGFTIIELLIVVVVIAILAAITVVGYNGIVSRAHDAAVQNDIKNLATEFMMYKTDNGVYPARSTQLPLLNFRISSEESYARAPATTSNLSVCEPDRSTNSIDKTAIIAMSASGNIFYAYSEEGFAVKSFPKENWHNEDTTSGLRCQSIDSDLGIPSGAGAYVFNGYNYLDTTTGPWRSWTKGGN